MSDLWSREKRVWYDHCCGCPDSRKEDGEFYQRCLAPREKWLECKEYVESALLAEDETNKDCTTCKHFDQAKPGNEALTCAGCPEYDPENTEVVRLSKWEPKVEPLTIADRAITADKIDWSGYR